MRGIVFILAPVVIFSFILVQGYSLSPAMPDKNAAVVGNSNSFHAKSPSETSSLQLGFFTFKTERASTPSCTGTSRPPINLLLDTSGSMEDHIPGLRSATRNFINKLADDNTVGIVEFNDNQSPRSQSARILMEMDKVSNNKLKVDSVLKEIAAEEDALTHMKDAFIFTQDLLDDFEVQSGSKIALIFLSDGKPDVKGGSDFDPEQDPSEIANKMKNNNIEIYTVAVGEGSDKNLMQKLASSEDKYFEAANGEQIDKAFSDIFNKFNCQ